MRICYFMLVALVALLWSCNPAPKYGKPPVQAPVAYKEATPQDYKEGEGWKVAQPGDDKIRGKWWEIYNDPQLNALEERVPVANQSIIASEANFRAARALVVSARAGLFPTITANPSYSNSRFSQTARGSTVVGGSSTSGTTTGTGSAAGTTTGGSTTSSSSSTSSTSSTGVAGNGSAGVINTYSLPFDVSYTVDLWHRVRNQIAANAYSAQASAGDLATALLSTQAELATDYFQVRASDAERRILENTVSNYTQTLKLTQALYRGGIDSEEDVAQAQTQLDTATAQLTDLGVSRATYEHAIAMLIGLPPASFSLEVAPFVPRPPEVPLALPAAILERRPDIAAAERRVAAANADIGVARAAYYPNLTLSAAAGFETSSFLKWFNWPSRFWSLGPTLSQTVFNGGALRAATEQAQASYDQAVANYRQTVLTAFQAVEDNLATLRILSQEVVEQHTAVNSAAHYLDLSMTRYKNGVDSYLNVITAQTTLLTNRETELQIQLRQMTASVNLVMALGGGWDANSIPQMKDLVKRAGKWQPATESAPVPLPADGAPNPPALPVDAAAPGAPNNPPQVPVPTPPIAPPVPGR